MNDPDDLVPLPAWVLAQRLDVHIRTLHREVSKLGVESSPGKYEGTKIACYPVGTLTILRSVVEQKRAEKALPMFMTSREIADALGKSQGWVTQAIKRNGFRVSKYEQRRAFRAALYNKRRVYKTLREEIRATQMAESGFNLTQLVDITGFDRDWIVNRLKEADIPGELRWSPLTGKALEFFNEDVVDLLYAYPQYPPAGNWLTADAIEKVLGKSTNWTRARLSKPDIRALGEIRLDPHRVPRLHYPPEVVVKLKAEITKAESFPLADDWLLVYQIANQLGRSKLWVQNRLEYLSILGEMRRDGKGRVKEHYPPDIGEKLLKAPDNLRNK